MLNEKFSLNLENCIDRKKDSKKRSSKEGLMVDT